MSLNSTYHKITGCATLVVMLWNLVGWLGFGLLMDHAHTHDNGSYCEITLCSCEVEEGQSVCTCHHNTPASSDQHDNKHAHEEFCYYDVPHNNNADSTQALIFSSKVNATYLTDLLHLYPLERKVNFLQIAESAMNGVKNDLLRPPRV